MMNAGTSTTTAAITNSIYLLYKHPKALSKLREELDAAAGTAEVSSSGKLAYLPYLLACIEESLSVQPASSFGIPRIVPKGGRGVVGQFIDEDATVQFRHTLCQEIQTWRIRRDSSQNGGSRGTRRK
ncbi:cytochrome P450 [Hyaloscypha finlandica]|nr:cytochrome P450 [Hyaloscypha finlandica]